MATATVGPTIAATFPQWRCSHCGIVQFKKPKRNTCLRCGAPYDAIGGEAAQRPLAFVDPLIRPMSRRFAEIRRAKGMTQKQVAEAMGSPRTFLTKIEHATDKHRAPNLGTWLKACTALGICFEDLVSTESPRRIAVRTIAIEGEDSELIVAVARILPKLNQEQRRELEAIFVSFAKGQLHFSDYVRV